MADSLGYTFQPSAEKRLRNAVNAPTGGGALGPQANEAIRILSLRLPTVLGGKPITVESLLKPGVGRTAAPDSLMQSINQNTAAPEAPVIPEPAAPSSVPASTPAADVPFISQTYSAPAAEPAAPEPAPKPPPARMPEPAPWIPAPQTAAPQPYVPPPAPYVPPPPPPAPKSPFAGPMADLARSSMSSQPAATSPPPPIFDPGLAPQPPATPGPIFELGQEPAPTPGPSPPDLSGLINALLQMFKGRYTNEEPRDMYS